VGDYLLSTDGETERTEILFRRIVREWSVFVPGKVHGWVTFSPACPNEDLNQLSQVLHLSNEVLSSKKTLNDRGGPDLLRIKSRRVLNGGFGKNKA